MTGAAGFLGRAVVRRLRAAGLRVVASDLRASSGIVAANLEDPRAAARLVRRVRPGTVVHLAGCAAPRGAAPPEAYHRANAHATLVLLRALAARPPRRFVLASTAEAYGRGRPPFREGDALLPESPYAVSKALAEAFTRAAAAWGIRSVVLRFALLYGEGDDPRRWMAGLLRALRGGPPFRMTRGLQRRDFLHVEDAAAAVVRAARRAGIDGETFNVGSGRSERLRDVARIAARIAGAPLARRVRLGALPTRPGEIVAYRLSVSAARRRLGWRAEISLEEGIRRTLGAEGS